MTYNITYLPSIRDYDVVVMNSWNVRKLEFLPPTETRRPEQIYAVYYEENPYNTYVNLNVSPAINWTMSYRYLPSTRSVQLQQSGGNYLDSTLPG